MKPVLEGSGCLVAIDNTGQGLRLGLTIMATRDQRSTTGPASVRSALWHASRRFSMIASRSAGPFCDAPVVRLLTSSPPPQPLLAVLLSALSLRALSAHQHCCHRDHRDAKGINAVCRESEIRRRESPSQNLESDYRKFFRFDPTCGHVEVNFLANAVTSATRFPGSESQPGSFATLVPGFESSAPEAESEHRKLR